mmetsp:Transcript_14140/g.22043  ORF Transcript_14140/g.22043 Transcript_14140/m.22043 type:complete len:111 (-) Transcript_14140:1080-1412(-)
MNANCSRPVLAQSIASTQAHSTSRKKNPLPKQFPLCPSQATLFSEDIIVPITSESRTKKAKPGSQGHSRTGSGNSQTSKSLRGTKTVKSSVSGKSGSRGADQNLISPRDY